MTYSFWIGFEKRAEFLSDFSKSEPVEEPGGKTQIPELGTRFSMTRGPRLDQLTVDSDRGKHEFFKG
jgi:hypothetical protein